MLALVGVWGELESCYSAFHNYTEFTKKKTRVLVLFGISLNTAGMWPMFGNIQRSRPQTVHHFLDVPPSTLRRKPLSCPQGGGTATTLYYTELEKGSQVSPLRCQVAPCSHHSRHSCSLLIVCYNLRFYCCNGSKLSETSFLYYPPGIWRFRSGPPVQAQCRNFKYRVDGIRKSVHRAMVETEQGREVGSVRARGS